MKKKFDIHQNPRQLSAQEIARHKNFDALLERFKAEGKSPRPAYRRMTFWLAAAAAAAVLALLLIVPAVVGDQDNYGEKKTAYFNQRPFIDPPFGQVEKKFASYRFDVSKGGVFEYPSGSKLTVPEGAFSHQNGSPVQGEVTIKYREMHDFVDFFLSGIPMTYDSAGVQYTLESAGMIEMFAEQNGQRVNMAPGKSIDVELVSMVNVSPQLNVPPGYNIYKLDVENRAWVYQNIDRMEMLNEGPNASRDTDAKSPMAKAEQVLADKLTAAQISEEAEMARLEASLPQAKRPVKPMLANNDEYVFDLDFNDLKKNNATGESAETQAELARMYRQYEKMLWQLSPDAGMSPQQLQREFSNVSDIAIAKLDQNTYQLTLSKGAQTVNVKVVPVLSGNDYQSALADFNRDFQRYEQQIKERETALAAQKKAIQDKYEQQRSAAKLSFQEQIAQLKEQGMGYAAVDEIIKRKVINRFTATNLGIWNCDRPLPPDMLTLKANFKDETGRSYANQTAFLVDKSRNTVYRFLAEDGAGLTFNLNSQNLLWLMTDDLKIAVFRPEDFKLIGKGTKVQDFVMRKVDKVIEDEEDVREVLYL